MELLERLWLEGGFRSIPPDAINAFERKIYYVLIRVLFPYLYPEITQQYVEKCFKENFSLSRDKDIFVKEYLIGDFVSWQHDYKLYILENVKIISKIDSKNFKFDFILPFQDIEIGKYKTTGRMEINTIGLADYPSISVKIYGSLNRLDHEFTIKSRIVDIPPFNIFISFLDYILDLK